jgi:hypothetical protein
MVIQKYAPTKSFSPFAETIHKTIMSSTSKLLFILASLALANALDVELRTVNCNPDLPVTAEIVLDCDGSARCTFGEPAMVNGTSKSTNVSLLDS